MEKKRQKWERIFMAAVIGLMALLAIGYSRQEYGFQTEEDATVQYVKGKVLEVTEQELTISGADGEYMLGYQELRIRLLEGKNAGEEVEISNYITVQHHVIPKEGSYVIVCADCPEGVEPYYTVYNYDRSGGIAIVVAIFALLVILVGRKQGVRSCIALLFTLEMVFCYLLPQLYEGKNAAVLTIVTVVFSCAVTCFCIGGLSRKTALNIASAVLGGISAGVMYELFSQILKVTGCNMDEAETLTIVAQSTGLKLEGVLFAAVTVAALGAVMDVAVSLGASLSEISILNPEITRKDLFRSGMNIGKDMIGTMTNTLILAFAGGSLATLLVFVAYGVQFHQLMSSNLIALEVSKGLAGSAAVVLTVPISAAVCAFGYGKHQKQQNGGK